MFVQGGVPKGAPPLFCLKLHKTGCVTHNRSWIEVCIRLCAGEGVVLCFVPTAVLKTVKTLPTAQAAGMSFGESRRPGWIFLRLREPRRKLPTLPNHHKPTCRPTWPRQSLQRFSVTCRSESFP